MLKDIHGPLQHLQRYKEMSLWKIERFNKDKLSVKNKTFIVWSITFNFMMSYTFLPLLYNITAFKSAFYLPKYILDIK